MDKAFVNYIAEKVAKHFGIPTPTFTREVRRGGYAKQEYYGKSGEFFTLPKWLADENTFFQIAYIAHEVCHHVRFTCHDKHFYENERSALALFDLEPEYRHGYRYVEALYVLGTKVPLWTKSTAKTKLSATRLSWNESR